MKPLPMLRALILLVLPAVAQAQQAFNTPEQAAETLVTAVTSHDQDALQQLLGDDWQSYFPPEGVDPQAVARFLRDWKTRHHIDQTDNTAHINVGVENWQLPVPLTKTEAGWQFDMPAAADEILTRTIGRNELGAIEAMHAWVDAENEYFQQKKMWAHKLVSSEGQQDGLYWPVKPGEDPSPLGPAFSNQPGDGYHGYHFRILSDGEDNNGVALIAWPVAWGKTGIMSFMVDMQDRVYQANLGAQTETQTQSITHFAPQAGWQAVDQ
ncbi:DUF2950 domain-containing protein [Superficieibacter electus]|uniref:DUF2950 domain-containing protein n=1 Tax=Superficieibacter electus TaxID=2022662 RepID=A0A2P5GMA7_9ENTR|nr:DUF2950 family protein [Superficieibacter electus]POP42027.1 DUF2950 domain-containing protein [Superficieibacter electus]POP46972.1 DUF2950 domain-containing protein [Superficieibacter electus]